MKPGLNTPEDDNDAHDFQKILGNSLASVLGHIF